MKFLHVLMDLIPVTPEQEAEIIEKGGDISTALIAAGLGLVAVALINIATKKNKK